MKAANAPAIKTTLRCSACNADLSAAGAHWTGREGQCIAMVHQTGDRALQRGCLGECKGSGQPVQIEQVPVVPRTNTVMF